MGNNIFLSAYLALAFPMTFMALTRQFIPHSNRAILQRTILVISYGAILAAQWLFFILAGHLISIISAGSAMLVMSIILLITLRQHYPHWLFLSGRAIVLPLIIILVISWNWGYLILEERPFNLLGQVRQHIWDSSIQLILPHRPLGIPDDSDAVVDSFNLIRPLIGYGPESMFNAFAFTYPPDLPHIEARGSSADRNHNDTLDILVTNGLLGVVAFYSFLVLLILTAFNQLGLVPHRQAKRWLIRCLAGGGLAGMLIAVALDNEGSRLTMMLSLGLPFGMLCGMISYLVGRLFSRSASPQSSHLQQTDLVLIGAFGGIVSYLIQAHFQFSIAATYLYFWVYAGLCHRRMEDGG